MSRIYCLIALAIAFTWVPALADGVPKPTSISGAAAEIDTWKISAGSAEGWAAGDRVRVTRGGQPVGEGVLMKVTPHASDVVATKSVVKIQKGDAVEFVRHKGPLPQDALPRAATTVRMPGSVSVPTISETQVPTDWKDVGTLNGLIGDDWMERHTKYVKAFARKGDIKYVSEVVDGLDTSYDVNHEFTGLTPKLPMEFYFFPLANPAHTQPRFAVRLANATRIAGVALGGTNIVCLNLGNWRTGGHFEPWEVAVTCRHEMNHLLAFTVRGTDRLDTWGWLYEALAHTIEDTARPASAQMKMNDIYVFLNGYHSADTSWKTLIEDRNNDSLEQYRAYDKILVSIIFFLQDKYGRDVVRRVLQGAQGKDIEDAFVQVTGKGTVELQAEWKKFYGI